MISIRIQNVSKHFPSPVAPKIAALKNVDIEIFPGEIFFLLGPSGCGKTTLLRMIAGFLFPDQGEILFDNQVVTRIPPYRRKVGMVFQNYALWPHLSVGQNIAFGLEQLSRSQKRTRVEEMLRTMGLEGLAERGIAELSGGQQQRVALARALAVQPTCLLLDEPLSNLDAQLRIKMRAELQNLCREKKMTTIHVTHDQKEALSSADRIAIMENGLVRQIGKPEDIYRNPTDSFVAAFIGDANLIPGCVTGIAGDKTVVQTELGVFYSKTSRFSTGSQCIVCIRPEALQLQPKKANNNNSFSAQIKNAFFLGQAIEYHLQTQVGQFLKVVDWRLPLVRHTGQIFLTTHSEDVILLKP